MWWRLTKSTACLSGEIRFRFTDVRDFKLIDNVV